MMSIMFQFCITLSTVCSSLLLRNYYPSNSARAEQSTDYVLGMHELDLPKGYLDFCTCSAVLACTEIDFRDCAGNAQGFRRMHFVS